MTILATTATLLVYAYVWAFCVAGGDADRRETP